MGFGKTQIWASVAGSGSIASHVKGSQREREKQAITQTGKYKLPIQMYLQTNVIKRHERKAVIGKGGNRLPK